MPRRNVVIDSARQWRQRMLRLERDDVLEPLYEQFDDNRATRNNVAAQMHGLQRQLDDLDAEGGRIAARIDDEERYYQQEDRWLVQWPKECAMEPAPAPALRFERRGSRPEPFIDWNPATPTVPCFVDRHPTGTQPHLITECENFKAFSATDRAHLIRRYDRCWKCWMPRFYADGRRHDVDNCPHARHCRRCRSNRHHEALCGAPLLNRSTWERTRRAELLVDQQ
jgi:hypothetical protein